MRNEIKKSKVAKKHFVKGFIRKEDFGNEDSATQWAKSQLRRQCGFGE